jgi:hypothetical protein
MPSLSNIKGDTFGMVQFCTYDWGARVVDRTGAMLGAFVGILVGVFGACVGALIGWTGASVAGTIGEFVILKDIETVAPTLPVVLVLEKGVALTVCLPIFNTSHVR